MLWRQERIATTMSEAPGDAIDTAAILEIVRATLPDLEFLYLFGSQASGDTHEQSDVDLAYRAGTRLDAVARFQLQERIAARIHRDVDLVDLATASTVMRVQVIDGGKVLYARDDVARQYFEMTALSSYARLNEERRGILEDVRDRGAVHG
jgi:Predicted nucleotidyltransferases